MNLLLEVSTGFDNGVVDRLVDSNREILIGKFEGDESLPIEVLAASLKDSIKSKLKGSASGFVFFENVVSGADGLVVFERSDWDSKHFGTNMGKFAAVLFHPLLGLQQRALLLNQAARKSGFSMLSARINLLDLLSIQALESQGGFLADVLLTFRFDLKKDPLVQPSNAVYVVEAVEEDSEELVRIGQRVFFADRFHSDPHFPKSMSDNYHGKWVLNSLHGLADAVLVAKESSRVVGFVSCKVERKSDDCKYGVIDLIGVHRSYQGHGTGVALVCSAIDWFAGKVGSVYVGTQASNARAISLYERCGFIHVCSEATFHWWLQPGLIG